MTLFFDIHKIKDSEPSGIKREKKTRHKIVTGKDLMMQTVEADPGVPSPPHRHAEEQLAYVLQGTVEISIEEEPFGNFTDVTGNYTGKVETYVCKPGTFFRVPSNALHSAKVLGDETVIWLAAYHPARPTYIADAVRLESKHQLPFR